MAAQWADEEGVLPAAWSVLLVAVPLSAAEQQQIRLFNEIERNADCDLPVDLVRDAPPAEPTAAPAPSARQCGWRRRRRR